MRKQKNIVVIGGGTGTFTVLSALKKYPVHLTAIVSMADDGGSTGVLRDQYGVLPPGDVRRALVALSDTSDSLRDLFSYRFSSGDFKGHNFGNIFLSSLEKINGNFTIAVAEASRMLNIKGRVLPVTLGNVRLYAKLCDNTLVKGEGNIDIPRFKIRSPISRVWLEPRATITKEAKEALFAADLVVLGPGDLYTSIVPNLLVDGMSEALQTSKAKKIYVCNLMTKRGETDNFCALDFVSVVERYGGEHLIDTVLCNTGRPSTVLQKKYFRDGCNMVRPLSKNTKRPTVIRQNFLDHGSFVRHNQEKLAQAIMRCV